MNATPLQAGPTSGTDRWASQTLDPDAAADDADRDWAAPGAHFDGTGVAAEAEADDDADAPNNAPPSHTHRTATAASPCATLDDAELSRWVALIAERDERALTALYDATVSRVYGLVLRILRRPAWAEEVVEDTYFQVWRQALRFDASRGKVLTWLLSMAHSRAIDALRRERRFDHEPIDTSEATEAAIGPSHGPAGGPGGAADDWLAMANGHAVLHRALLGLGAQPRQLVAMAFFRGLSHEEIAAQMALPLGTVKSQIRRALLALREVLGDAGLQALPG